ncbi:MAG: hypothetical protein PHT19_01040 [Methylococcus sp.]|nr:hypothetical protein [Methylococcus sp.]
MKLGISSFPKAQIMVCAALAIAQTADAKPFFTGIGFLPGGQQSIAASVSRDGALVGGTAASASGDSYAIRWSTKSKKLKNFGIPKNYTGSTIAAISGGGKVMVGSAYDMSAGTMQAVKWNGGKSKAMGYLSGGFFSRADAVSENGSVIVGTSTTPDGFRAYRWTKKLGMVDLGDLGGSHASVGWGVSADGKVAVGFTSTPETDNNAFRWTQDGGMVALGNAPGSDGSGANRISADGNVTVGYCTSGNLQQACRWIGLQAAQGLSTLSGYDNTILTSTSGDGSIATGMAHGLFNRPGHPRDKDSNRSDLGRSPWFACYEGRASRGLQPGYCRMGIENGQ